ncbi:MAG TPA: hypothetical protein VK327_03530 [Candidatus Paceibacterota bacterium]|nr:hypothetical protein [Candidatus Paceibacterota bacterium]
MNPLIRKEVRNLLPSFVVAAALALSFWFVRTVDQSMVKSFFFLLPMMVCPAFVLRMCLESIGGEITPGTFANLLVQPISRNRLWWTKSLLLLAAMALISIIWMVSFTFEPSMELSPAEKHEGLIVATLFAVTFYSGALWTVLLFRHVGLAFWITLVIPAALVISILYSLAEKHPEHLNVVISAVLAVYSAGGFLFARWLFLNAQDLQWSGGVIRLPQWRAIPNLFAGSGKNREHRPFRAMLRREFLLHQPHLLIAALLCVVHLGALGARSFRNWSSEHPILDFVLNLFWMLWFSMPILIGCNAVAEERRMGTLEGQLCLPVKRRSQFVIKLCVALLLGSILGALMPVALEYLGGKSILPEINVNELSRFVSDFPHLKAILWPTITFSPYLPLLGLMLACALAGGISFFASTLSRSTLQALGPAVLAVFFAVCLNLFGVFPERILGYPLWRGFLVYLIGAPVLILTTVLLAHRNYRHVQTDWRLWVRNLTTLSAALAFVILATTTIYHRAWEFVFRGEPPHGPARIAMNSSVTLQDNYGSLSVELPDGRVWTGYSGYSFPTLGTLLTGVPKFQVIPGSRFVEDTNWAAVANCIFDTVAIKTDGSLWVSEKPWSGVIVYYRGMIPKSPSPLVKFGDDNDWKSVVAQDRGALLLKNDGTLWTWNMNSSTNKWPGLRALPLEQVGTDRDWSELSKLSRWIYLRKSDGRVWCNCPIYSDRNPLHLPGQTIPHAPFLASEHYRSITRLGDPGSRLAEICVGIRSDGTLDEMPDVLMSPRSSIQLNNQTNWLSLARNGNGFVALKSDGTLWQWHLEEGLKISHTPERLGTHSDWIALVEDQSGFIALATDGSLWFWINQPNSLNHPSWENTGFPSLTRPSRKPLLVGNIFAAASETR